MDIFTDEQREEIRANDWLYAIKLSIQKHKDILAKTGHDYNDQNCAMCVRAAVVPHKWRHQPWGGIMAGCVICPLVVDADQNCNFIGSYWSKGDTKGLIKCLVKLAVKYRGDVI